MDIAIPLALCLLILGLSVVVSKLIQQFLRPRKSQGRYPPGPKPLPLIGNTLDVPVKGVGEKYLEWGRRYNTDLVHISTLSDHIVVINKREVAEELLEKHAAKYSGRPDIPVLKLIGWDCNVALMDNGQEWRNHRRICQQHFNKQAAQSFQDIQLNKARKMLQSLLSSPENYSLYSNMFSTSISMAMMYGYEVESLDDPAVKAANKSIEVGSPLTIPGGTLINVFPFLRHIPGWVPGAVSQRQVALGAFMTREMQRIPLEDLKKRMAEGKASPSFVSNFFEKKNTVGASDEEESMTYNIAHTVYAAASDTTISATGTFFYCMAANPAVQKKAQEEIDRITGGSQLPDFSDREAMPYLEAVYREVMRYRPPLPLTVSRSLSEDDHYRDYFFPKGTLIFANIWGMTHDEDVYPEPDVFKPERFFNVDGKLNDNDRIMAFGFGRRICAGQHIASSTMWIIIASILASFNISNAKDEFGNDIPLNDEYDDFGLLAQENDEMLDLAKVECSAKIDRRGTVELIASWVAVYMEAKGSNNRIA
ncbi:unnamed protein product [Cyclocybe aegerita]|uniref:Cytochrome P450 n=1 Tax=Cyclocybe aegerita TaxID=1973307 RepID=A0A8S0XI46_CYCAE|nr:unnamed protein product [Cyclocybe aegerita]